MHLRKLLQEDLSKPSWPRGVRVAPFNDGRYMQAHALLVEAYKFGGGQIKPLDDWWTELRADREYSQSLFILAVDANDHIVGLAQCWTSAFLKDLAVSERWRRGGVGEALLLHVFNIFRDRGSPYLDLKVEDQVSTAVTEETIIASQTEFMANCQPFFPALTDRIASVADETAKRAGDESVQLEKIAKSTVATTFAVVVGGLVIVLLAGFFAIRAWMVTPIKVLAQAMARLSGGDFSTEVGGSERRDEIGGMAKAVQVFKDNGLEAQALAAESAIMRDEAETSRQKTAENDRVRADAMARATSGLGEGLKHLAGGDLTFQLVEPFAIDFETLRTDFNAAVGQLSKTLRVVADATGAIDNGSREVSASAEDLSRRTEQQAASLEETAAALDEITVNVANSSKRADEARKIALQANESANQSGKIVASAVNAMQRIEQSSNEISNIIGVIDEIAFQTNLLALNAGVEAARAGDAGKGFAVVAQEVRELAQRSAKAAKEIKELIGNSSAEVQSGVKLVSDTGVALKTIESYIVAVNQHMDSIATSAREQSVGLAEVNTAVNQMDQVTQQNAAMVEETSAAGVNLANESGRLRELISQFQLGNSHTQRASAKLAA